MEFNQLKDLINSEGPILTLVESVDNEEMTNERLYIRALCLKGKGFIYCKINPTALEMFFQGRLSVKDLYLLRADEYFIIEYSGNQDVVFSDEAFIAKVISGIEYATSHYYDLPAGIRISDPFGEVLHFVNRDYFNGHVSISTGVLFGLRWMQENRLI